jgi:predicted ribosomally synthesized peptide with nif11-like leader
MAMNAALQFIDRVRRDADFRGEAYEADCPEHFTAWVEKAGYRFSSGEIDDAFRSLLLKARDEEAAEEIRELRQWYLINTKTA